MIIQITARIIPDYHCSTCRAIETGTDAYVLEASSITELENIIGKIQASPPRSGIPIGWASFGEEGIKCFDCLKGG